LLESACAGDQPLRHELESLLANDGFSPLARSALDVAARAIVQHLAPSWVGRTIRSYEILALLGAGGRGEVYRARPCPRSNVTACPSRTSSKGVWAQAEL
jgi:hypothetical protein